MNLGLILLKLQDIGILSECKGDQRVQWVCHGLTSTRRSQEKVILCGTSWWWRMHFVRDDFRKGIVEEFELEWILKIIQCCIWTSECLCLKGKGMEWSWKTSKNMSRNGSWGTDAIKELFCFSIVQPDSKLILPLIPLQFPGFPSPRESTKHFNEVINLLLWSLYVQLSTGSAALLWMMGRVRCNLCFNSNWSHTSHKMWNLRNYSQEPALSLILAFCTDFLLCSFVIFVILITPCVTELGSSWEFQGCIWPLRKFPLTCICLGKMAVKAIHEVHQINTSCYLSELHLARKGRSVFVFIPSVEILRKGPSIDNQAVPPKKSDPLLLWKIDFVFGPVFLLVWRSLFW